MRSCFILLSSVALAVPAFAGNAPRFTFGFTGSNVNSGAIAVDPQGNTYLAASTGGNSIPATPGAYQQQYKGGTCFSGSFPIPCRNAVIAKLDPLGKVVFTTYLGGTANDDPLMIAYGADGSVFVGGSVETSPGSAPSAFPITSNAAFKSISGTAGIGAFLAKLNPAGTALEYSTFLPGLFLDSIAVDSEGAVYFVGESNSVYGGFPATPGAYRISTANSNGSAAIGKLSPDGSTLVWGAYLSGTSGVTVGGGIALDSAGNVLIGGSTTAADFPATSGQFSTGYGTATDGYRNLFLAKLSADGSRLLAANLLGPAAGRLTMGPGGDLYVGAYSPSLPVSSSGFGLSGGLGNYLLRLSPDGSSVTSSLRLPFVLQTISVDAGGNAYLIGAGTITPTPGAYETQPTGAGPYYPVIAKVGADSSVQGVTYFDRGVSQIAVEQDGSVTVAGGNPGAYFAANIFPSITLENTASYAANLAAPGELVAIRGYGIGPDQGQSSSPTTDLGGVQVFFDNFPAPLMYAQAGQVNAQVPWQIAGQASTQMKIVYNGGNAGSVTVPLTSALPGIFYIGNADGSPNSSTNPAHAGDTVAIYGTGGGVLSPAGVAGGNWPLSPLSRLSQSAAVSIDGQPAAAIPYAGSAPTLNSGIFQINVTLPRGIAQGSDALILSIGGVSAVPVTLWVQ